MKRILITGATSWIGSEVEAHLAAFPGGYGVERVSLRGDAWKERSWEGRAWCSAVPSSVWSRG